MNKLDLTSINIKITNSNGCEISIPDPDNLKYRVIRAAHSVRDYNRKFTVFHWQKGLVNVKLINFDPKSLLLITPLFPPCIRALAVEGTAKRGIPRKFYINGESYDTKKDDIDKKNNEEIVDLHDLIDDAEGLLSESPEEVDYNFKTFFNTKAFNEIGIDFEHALLCLKLFEKYLSKSSVLKCLNWLFINKKKIDSPDFYDPEFRKTINPVLEKIQKEISESITEAQLQKLIVENPSLIKAIALSQKQDTLFHKMFVILLDLFPDKKPRHLFKLRRDKTVSVSNVQFSTELIKEKLENLKRVIALAKIACSDELVARMDLSPIFQKEYALSYVDELTLDNFIAEISKIEAVQSLFYNLFKSLEARCSNSLLNQLKIDRINRLIKEQNHFKSFCLILDFQNALKKWQEKNARST